MGVYYSPSPQLQGKTIQKNCLEWADLLGNQAEILWQYWICTPWYCYFKSVCNSKEIENFKVSRRSSRRLYNFRMSTVDSKSAFINFDATFSFHNITISNFFLILYLAKFSEFQTLDLIVVFLELVNYKRKMVKYWINLPLYVKNSSSNVVVYRSRTCLFWFS